MKFNGKGLFSRTLLILSVGNLLVYLLMHLSFNMSADLTLPPDGVFLFEQVRHYITDAWELIFPVVTAALMLTVLRYEGGAAAFLGGSLVSLSRIFYSAFYYYITFISVGYDTAEAIPYALLASVGAVAVTFVTLAVITGVGYIFLSRSKSKEPISKIPSVLLSLTAVQFIIFLVLEVVDTVSFFLEVGLDYTAGEILLICFNYLYILAVSLLCYYLTRLILSRTEKKRLN